MKILIFMILVEKDKKRSFPLDNSFDIVYTQVEINDNVIDNAWKGLSACHCKTVEASCQYESRRLERYVRAGRTSLPVPF